MTKVAISLASLVMATALVGAQPPDDRPPQPEGRRAWRQEPGGPGPGAPGPGGAFLQVLDRDDDGVISAEEISQAPESLLQLDRNGDGELRRNEWMPRPGRGDLGDRPRPGAQGERRGPPEDGDRPGRGRRNEADRPAPPPRLDEGPGRRRADNQGPPSGRLVDRLMQFDEDGDGQLNPDEIPERLLPMMEGADTNEDGMIDREELQALAGKMRERFREGRAGPARPRRAGSGRGFRRRTSVTCPSPVAREWPSDQKKASRHVVREALALSTSVDYLANLHVGVRLLATAAGLAADVSAASTATAARHRSKRGRHGNAAEHNERRGGNRTVRDGSSSYDDHSSNRCHSHCHSKRFHSHSLVRKRCHKPLPQRCHTVATTVATSVATAAIATSILTTAARFAAAISAATAAGSAANAGGAATQPSTTRSAEAVEQSRAAAAVAARVTAAGIATTHGFTTTARLTTAVGVGFGRVDQAHQAYGHDCRK